MAKAASTRSISPLHQGAGDGREAARTKKEPTLSQMRPPKDLSLEDWQRGLRRQHGRAQKYAVKNLGDDPVFSEFSVHNPVSRNT